MDRPEKRTFHDHKHPLHGITVLVELRPSDNADPGDGADDSGGGAILAAGVREILIGRCDDLTEDQVIILDGAHHEGGDGPELETAVQRAYQLGIWKQFDRRSISLDRVLRVRPLGSLGVSGASS